MTIPPHFKRRTIWVKGFTSARKLRLAFEAFRFFNSLVLLLRYKLEL
jgi:hypothetical protein